MRYINIADRIFYKADKEKIWRLQNGCCYYCGRKLSRDEITADHVIPLRETHYHSSGNIVIACFACNQLKGHKRDFVYEKPIFRVFEDDSLDLLMKGVLQRIDERVKLAEWRLDLDGKGSYSKWKKFWEKRGRWN